MILKFNNGRGAVLCEQCSIIIMQDMRDYEWHALQNMNDAGKEWFCKSCAPDIQKEQSLDFLDEVDKIAPLYSREQRNKLNREFYTEW